MLIVAPSIGHGVARRMCSSVKGCEAAPQCQWLFVSHDLSESTRDRAGEGAPNTKKTAAAVLKPSRRPAYRRAAQEGWFGKSWIAQG